MSPLIAVFSTVLGRLAAKATTLPIVSRGSEDLSEYPDATTSFLDRLEQLIERLGHEQNVLEVIDLKRLVEYGVE